MSADNGVYILKCKDQYRVAHLQAIENVFWSCINGSWQDRKYTKGKLVPTRVVEMWGECKFTRNFETALSMANKWCSSLPICEYGVSIITYNKTWKHIVEDAKEYAVKEIQFLSEKEYMSGYEEYQIEKLKKLVS